MAVDALAAVYVSPKEKAVVIMGVVLISVVSALNPRSLDSIHRTNGRMGGREEDLN
ncbi:hypothetical protein K440DRAFT_634320 [Wilcoxina mikolae CBS 423.85]|nr:hypothetical protein K440DRAFT_634320 [Wilcoxina mikolae CBS 423.85]